MAQALLLASGVATPSLASTLSLHACAPPSQQGNASIATASVVSRSKFVLDRQLLYKSGNIERSRGSGIRRSRLLAVAELQEAATAADQQSAELLSSAVKTLPLNSEIQTLDSSPSYPATLDDAPSFLTGNGGADPEMNIPEPNSSTVLPSVDATVTQTLPAYPAAASSPGIVESGGTGPDVLQGARESIGNPAELTPLQRYEALINRANGGGGKMKLVPVEEDGTSFSFPDSIEAAQEAVRKTFIDIQDAINDSVGSAGNAISNIYENINGSIKISVDSVTGSIKGSVNSVTGLYDNTVDDIQTSVGSSVSKAAGEVADFTSIFRTGTPLNNQLKEVVVVVKGAAGTALEAAEKVLTDVYGTARDSLPPETQSSLSVAEQKAQEISEPLGSFLQQAYGALEEVERALGVDPGNPIIPVILVVGGTLYLGISFWQGRYGGYSGDLMPTSAFDLLKKEGNAVLVDIRPQELRKSEGIPDLRRGLRTRFATVETITVDGSLRSRLKNAKEIDSILTSSVIRNLKTVSPGTKVIVMDNDGSQSKEIARALRRFGVRRRYRVEGGYKAWAAAGLRTKLEGTDTTISILQEDAAEIVEEVKPTPGGVVLVALGLMAGVYAAFEWEKTLQLLGVVGIGQAIYSRANSYESLEDAKADLRLLQKPFRSLGDEILRAVGQVKPGTLQLAISPSTSAVQDRVVQAAAKHGPLASELVEDRESEAEVDVQTSPEISALSPTAEGGPGDSSPPTASE
ncbi:hypothetical protein M758_5G102400 [Ceratodon purpureus]|nr:hypothetical protein M758_5G102400 [Ceratodon purpureus]